MYINTIILLLYYIICNRIIYLYTLDTLYRLTQFIRWNNHSLKCLSLFIYKYINVNQIYLVVEKYIG